MEDREIPRDDAEATLGARLELGRDFEPEIVDSFVERIERAIDARVDGEVQRQLAHATESTRELRRVASERSGQALALAIVSVVMCVPISIVISEKAGVVELLLACGAIVLINFAFNLGGRIRP